MHTLYPKNHMNPVGFTYRNGRDVYCIQCTVGITSRLLNTKNLQQHADSIAVLYSLFCVYVYTYILKYWQKKSYERLNKGTFTALVLQSSDWLSKFLETPLSLPRWRSRYSLLKFQLRCSLASSIFFCFVFDVRADMWWLTLYSRSVWTVNVAIFCHTVRI